MDSVTVLVIVNNMCTEKGRYMDTIIDSVTVNDINDSI